MVNTDSVYNVYQQMLLPGKINTYCKNTCLFAPFFTIAIMMFSVAINGSSCLTRRSMTFG